MSGVGKTPNLTAETGQEVELSSSRSGPTSGHPFPPLRIPRKSSSSWEPRAQKYELEEHISHSSRNSLILDHVQIPYRFVRLAWQRGFLHFS